MTPQNEIRLVQRLMKERIDFPPMKEGKYEIQQERHATGRKLMVRSFREAIFSGRKPSELLLSEDTTIHKLVGPEGVWMTDLPYELLQMYKELALRVHGHVLIGGLGLGVLPKLLLPNSAVKLITVIERQPEVIRMVASYLHRDNLRGIPFTVVQEDIHNFVHYHLGMKLYDYALLDTWQGTGEWAWQTEVVPLRRALAGKTTHVRCWSEGVMLGQVAQGLLNFCEAPADELKCKSHCHYYAFRRAVMDAKIRSEESVLDRTSEDFFKKLIEIEVRNRADLRLKEFMRRFLYNVGTPFWERTFGKYWDEAWEVGR